MSEYLIRTPKNISDQERAALYDVAMQYANDGDTSHEGADIIIIEDDGQSGYTFLFAKSSGNGRATGMVLYGGGLERIKE